MIDPASLRLSRERAALLVIDVQERLAAAMPPQALATLERNVAILAEVARRFGVPVVLSEQYPRGLGKTTGPIAAALEPLGANVHRLEKVEFSAARAEAFEPIWSQIRRDHWIVCGMESHVCVYQTARDLLERDARVHLVRDAVCSRAQQNADTGVALMDRAGAIITTTEIVAFDLLGAAGSEDFKAISRLIR